MFAIGPGITGIVLLASIDMPMPERLEEADSRNMHHRGFPGHLNTIARTVLGGGAGEALN